MTRAAYLVEAQAYDTGIPGLTTLRYGSQDYSDPSAPGKYSDRITQLPTFRRDIFSRATTGGAGSVSQGDLILANGDGGLDGLRNYGLAGQMATLLIGDPAAAYSGFVSLLVGKIEQALFDLAAVTIRLKDRLQDLQQPLQPNKYAGTNALPNGLEGIADLQGKPKPKVFGQVSNVSPPCVNTSRLEYQVNDGAVNDVTAVYDAGSSIPRGAPDYTSQSDMETNAPLAGNFRVWKGGGLFRLGTSPTGTITCDVLEGSNAAARTAAQIAQRIVTGTGGISAGDVSAADVTALDTANSAVLGIWLPSETTFAACLDQVLGSVGAWYGFDRLGKLRMQRLEAPGTSVANIRRKGRGVDASVTDFDMIDPRFLPTKDPDKGVPTWRASLTYDLNNTVQPGNGLNGGVTLPRRNYLAAATRSVIASDATVQTPNPQAVQKNVDTLFVSQTDAQAEANRLLALFKVRRDFIEIDTALTAAVAQALDIGSTVTVYIPRFGYDSGRKMVVTGMEYNTIKARLTLALWG